MAETRRQREGDGAAARQAPGRDTQELLNAMDVEEERLRQAESKARWVQVGRQWVGSKQLGRQLRT